jgi:crotonobetainyl-CoA:carnitine CoA-transferase CaiB-like acyl-CoA transferase
MTATENLEFRTEKPRTGPLAGMRVIDAATVYAGPLAATMLGDFGADVIKVEHPDGDSARTHGRSKDGVGLWWKVLGRNKRTVTAKLSTPEGRELFLDLVRTADVLIENFRPGCSSAGVSPPSCCTRSTRGWSSCGSPGSDRPVRPRSAAPSAP